MTTQTNILLESGTNELEIVEFILIYNDDSGKPITQSFGMNVAKVREIIRMPQLTKLPNLHEGVLGVFNLRNSLIPALDLSKYLYNIDNVNSNRKMIITEFNKIRCGFIVNEVNRIHRISWGQIDSPESLQEFDSDKSSIIGIIKLESKNILMIDIERIVAEIDPKSAIDTKEITSIIKGKPKVITAEDSPTIRKMISNKLNLAGFEIKSYNDGYEAWEELEHIAEKAASGYNINDYVDIVITDIEMPRLDGYSLTKYIKSNQYLSKLPVVIFSSLINREVIHKGKSVGADAQLTKPQIGELLEVVGALLAQ